MKIHEFGDFFLPSGETATLVIKEVTLDDAGKYTCRITNTGGTSDSSAKLLVDTPEVKVAKVKPKFDTKIKDVDAIKGEKAEFKCVLQGHPRPDVSWYYKHRLLIVSGYFLDIFFNSFM